MICQGSAISPVASLWATWHQTFNVELRASLAKCAGGVAEVPRHQDLLTHEH